VVEQETAGKMGYVKTEKEASGRFYKEKAKGSLSQVEWGYKQTVSGAVYSGNVGRGTTQQQ